MDKKLSHELKNCQMKKMLYQVPQGTCLGPLLMLVMNSDIDIKIKNGKTGTLADDTKVTNVLKCNSDNTKMQEDLNSLEHWSEMNNVKMNDDKFVLLCYNSNPQIINNHYSLKSGIVIQESKGTRDLGVWMSNDATFTEHISNVTTSCKKIMSMIFRSFTSRDNQLMITLYKSLILSKIDYCSVLWNPTNMSDLRQLEGIQATYTNRMQCAKAEDSQKRNYWE